jgi:hypothetical protein
MSLSRWALAVPHQGLSVANVAWLDQVTRPLPPLRTPEGSKVMVSEHSAAHRWPSTHLAVAAGTDV